MADATRARDALRRSAQSFRLGMEAEGSTHLAAFVDAVIELSAGEARIGAGELDALCGQVVAAQERGDVLFVADLLEHELLPRLG
jgi:hypothetical protein